MSINLPENQTENSINKSDTERSLYDPNKLINISVQAKILSWFILVISVIFLGAATINFVTEFFSRANYGGYAFNFGDMAFLVASSFQH